jgi:hypothetical protein
MPTFTYLDEKTDKYVCRGRLLTRVEIHQLQEYIDLSRSMCEYMREEDRILTHGRNITYERYAYHRLRIKEEEVDKEFVPKLAGDLSSGQLAHNRFLEHQTLPINPSRPAPPAQRIEEPVQTELKAPELIPRQHSIQHSLLLGHVFPATGFLLTNGPDFIIREMSDFKVPGTKMLLLLVTGKPIKTGGIHIAWSGSNIHIDTTGSGMATYQISVYAVRGFVAIHYPDLASVCEHDSQSWCYMKNGGNLCIRAHKHQDGGDLSF